MSTTSLLFVCQHGAAKSIMAAAYTAYLAQRHGVHVHVASAGTEPDAAIMPAVTALMHAEGVAFPNDAPRALTQADVDRADRVITLGCSLDLFDLRQTSVEYWDNIPLPSINLAASRDAIYLHAAQLITELQREDQV